MVRFVIVLARYSRFRRGSSLLVKGILGTIAPVVALLGFRLSLAIASTIKAGLRRQIFLPRGRFRFG